MSHRGEHALDRITATWATLPDGGPTPTLQEGSTGAVVSSLQTLLATTPQGIDGDFGPHKRLVEHLERSGIMAQTP
jgi:hypothetical protein